MTSITTKELPSKEQIQEATVRRYPAMLLGQMGIDKKHRGEKIGAMVTHFCTGLALNIAKRVACRYLVLQTDENHLEYYRKYCFFTPTIKSKEKKLIMMYRRLY